MTELEGKYSHKIDAKGRLSLPADFRKVLSPELKMVPSPSGECLMVFEPDDYVAWLGSLFEANGGFNSASRQMTALRKILNSRVKTCEIDASGRINIPVEQREAAGLGKEVVIIGDADHFEIWDEKRWDAFCSEFDAALASLVS